MVLHYIFTQYRIHLTQVIQYDKVNYYREIFTNYKNVGKKIWGEINELKGNFRNINAIEAL